MLLIPHATTYEQLIGLAFDEVRSRWRSSTGRESAGVPEPDRERVRDAYAQRYGDDLDT